MNPRVSIAIAIVAAAALCLVGIGTAAAQAPGEVGPQPNPSAAPAYGPSEVDTIVTVKRYGHHVLLADGAFLALTVASKEPVLVFSYLLTGPAVHAIHGNPGRAVGSLLLRAGAPVAGALTGMALENCSGSGDGDFCGLAGFVLGGLAGMVTAVVVDAAVLARETVRETPRFVPVASVTKNGTMQLGLAGRF